MTSFRIRPKFELDTDKTVETIIRDVQQKLSLPGASCRGLAMQDHITLKVKAEDQHFWSPQLSVLLLEDPHRKKTHVIGVYGPMPNVWTLFAVSYLAIGILFLFIAIVGFSQYSLGMECQVLWALPFLAILAVVLYVMSQFGQKLGAEQTFDLHHFFEEVIEQKIHVV